MHQVGDDLAEIDFFFLSVRRSVKATPSMEEAAPQDASKPLGSGFDGMATMAMRTMVRIRGRMKMTPFVGR
jgi:hypothetical protein